MAYGLATYVDGVDVVLTTRPFNPVLSIRFTNMGTQNFNFTLPDGIGDVVFTNTIDRPQIDKYYGGSSLSTPRNVTISGNSVTIEFIAVTAGVAVNDFTFYRVRT